MSRLAGSCVTARLLCSQRVRSASLLDLVQPLVLTGLSPPGTRRAVVGGHYGMVVVVVGDLLLSNLCRLSSPRFMDPSPRRLRKKKPFISSVISTSSDVGRCKQVWSGLVYQYPDRPTLSLDRLNFIQTEKPQVGPRSWQTDLDRSANMSGLCRTLPTALNPSSLTAICARAEPKLDLEPCLRSCSRDIRLRRGHGYP